MSEFDYALVEDISRHSTEENTIIACAALHRVRGFYGSAVNGIDHDFFFGKPELIATDPDYRNLGLVRKLLIEMIHPESDARGIVYSSLRGSLIYISSLGTSMRSHVMSLV